MTTEDNVNICPNCQQRLGSREDCTLCLCWRTGAYAMQETLRTEEATGLRTALEEARTWQGKAKEAEDKIVQLVVQIDRLHVTLAEMDNKRHVDLYKVEEKLRKVTYARDCTRRREEVWRQKNGESKVKIDNLLEAMDEIAEILDDEFPYVAGIAQTAIKKARGEG